MYVDYDSYCCCSLNDMFEVVVVLSMLTCDHCCYGCCCCCCTALTMMMMMIVLMTLIRMATVLMHQRGSDVSAWGMMMMMMIELLLLVLLFDWCVVVVAVAVVAVVTTLSCDCDEKDGGACACECDDGIVVAGDSWLDEDGDLGFEGGSVGGRLVPVVCCCCWVCLLFCFLCSKMWPLLFCKWIKYNRKREPSSCSVRRDHQSILDFFFIDDHSSFLFFVVALS